MNLVKLIMDQMSGDTMGKLSGLLGADRSSVTSAVTAAVPAILAGMAGMASDEDGARKLSNTLSSIDTSTAGDFMRSPGGDTGSIVQKGGNLLGSLFGSSTRSGMVDSISRFSGLGSGATSNLLSFLAPMMLGKLATVWKGSGGGASGLTAMFADQKQNIANAIPSGFSLGSIPGLSSALGSAGSAAGAASSSVAGTSRRAVANVERTSRSGLGWVAALAAALVVGLIVWNVRRTDEPMRSPTSAMPTVENVTTSFRGALNSLGDVFTGINDAASANAAVPKLRELNTELSELQSMFNALPESSQNALRNTVGPQLNTLKSRASELLNSTGLNTECRNQLELILQKLSDWGTTTPAAMPISTP